MSKDTPPRKGKASEPTVSFDWTIRDPGSETVKTVSGLGKTIFTGLKPGANEIAPRCQTLHLTEGANEVGYNVKLIRYGGVAPPASPTGFTVTAGMFWSRTR